MDTSEEDEDDHEGMKSNSEEESLDHSSKRLKTMKVEKLAGQGPNWQIMYTIWMLQSIQPLTERKTVESMSINIVLYIYKIHAKREKKESGQAIAKVSKNRKP